MIPSQVIRTLGRTAELCGVSPVLRVALARGDGATHADLLEVLGALTHAVDHDRPARTSPAGRRLDPEAERVLEMVARGMRDPEIAVELGISKPKVRGIRRRHGVAGHETGPRKTGWEEPTRAAWDRNLTAAEMAEELGVPRSAVYHRLHKLGLAPHPDPANPGRRSAGP